MKMMTTTTTMRTSLKLGLLAPLTLIGLAAAPHARADNILLAQTTMVVGTESTVDSFTTTGAGTVSVSLQNLKWPTTLSALSFSATSANQVLWDTSGDSHMSGAQGTFTVDGAGTYFAHIMATADGTSANPFNIGLYSLLMTFKPNAVPLPASGWMLLTGMFVLAGLAWAARPFELMGTAEA